MLRVGFMRHCFGQIPRILVLDMVRTWAVKGLAYHDPGA